VEGNLQKARDLIEKANPEESDLVVLPEMFPCGFVYRSLDHIAKKSVEVLDWMSEVARCYRLGLAGSLPTLIGNGIANTMVFMDKSGDVLAGYDKIHLFPATGEDKYFAPGNRTVVLSWEGITIGLVICFDLRFPEMARRLCEEGVQMVAVSAQWPLERVDHFRDLVRVRAMENQIFVAACNSCGEDDEGMVLGGESMVAGPSGEIHGALGIEEGVLSLKISLDEVEKIRERFPVVKCRRKDIFS